VGRRVSAGLAEVARAGGASVLPVLDALQELLAVLPGRKDAGAFVELAADLAERTGRTVQLPALDRTLQFTTEYAFVRHAISQADVPTIVHRGA
jgi:hypothetical protein